MYRGNRKMALHHRLHEERSRTGQWDQFAPSPYAAEEAPRPHRTTDMISPERARQTTPLYAAPVTPMPSDFQQQGASEVEIEPRMSAPAPFISTGPTPFEKQRMSLGHRTPPPTAQYAENKFGFGGAYVGRGTPPSVQSPAPHSFERQPSARERILAESRSKRRSSSPGSSAFRSSSPRFGGLKSVLPEATAIVADRGSYVKPLLSTSHDFYVPRGIGDVQTTSPRGGAVSLTTTPRFVNMVPHGSGMVCPVLTGTPPRRRTPSPQTSHRGTPRSQTPRGASRGPMTPRGGNAQNWYV